VQCGVLPPLLTALPDPSRALFAACSYVYAEGALQPVPASRADLFADRALSLADKRSLGRFMAACVEAAEGSGRLKVSDEGCVGEGASGMLLCSQASPGTCSHCVTLFSVDSDTRTFPCAAAGLSCCFLGCSHHHVAAAGCV
jgi:hypothetical protein